MRNRKIVIRLNAPVVLTFALLALLATFLGIATNGEATYRYFSVYRSSLSAPLTYLRLFTHVLGHEGYSHYMSNMLLLLLVGPAVEERYGHRAAFGTIIATALVTGLVQFLFFPNSMLMGASGVVFMMIVLSSFTEMKKGDIPITLIFVVIFYLGREIVDGLFSSDNISQLTHITGGILGLIFGFTMQGRRR